MASSIHVATVGIAPAARNQLRALWLSLLSGKIGRNEFGVTTKVTGKWMSLVDDRDIYHQF